MSAAAESAGKHRALIVEDDPGFAELVRLILERDSFPVLMLSGRADVTDRVRGLRAGADDYMAKPFDPRELVARVHALIRRAHLTHPPPRTPRR